MNYINQMFGLEGKSVIITGGAGAIGTTMSNALLNAGANVMLWSRSQKSLDKAFEKLNRPPESRCQGLTLDTGDESAVQGALEQSINRFEKIDILINGVGGNLGKSPFVETDMEQFAEVMQMNLMAGLMIPTKVFCRYWIENKIKGNIINLTSITSYKPLSGVWAYNASKAAVLNLTQGAANEFAPFGIRVNAITPGFFIGKQNKDLLIDNKTGKYTDRGQAIIKNTPFERFGSIEELEGVTLFLASDRASGFVTGVSIPVDGGFLIHSI